MADRSQIVSPRRDGTKVAAFGAAVAIAVIAIFLFASPALTYVESQWQQYQADAAAERERSYVAESVEAETAKSDEALHETVTPVVELPALDELAVAGVALLIGMLFFWAVAGVFRSWL